MKWSISWISLLFVFTSLWGQNSPPTITSSTTNPKIREMDLVQLVVFASDPDGDPLTYSWTIATDPTGDASFKGTSSSSLVKLTLKGGSGAHVGQQISVDVDISDGTNPAVSHTFTVTVSGVNLPPNIVVNTAGMGTFSNPKLSGGGIGLNASGSDNGEGLPAKFLWQIIGISGGKACEAVFVLFGKETETPGLPVPLVTALPKNPMSITFKYTVEDGLHVVTGSYTGYMASPNGCTGATNPPPTVSASALPAHAAFGETVLLNGSATDPGDTLTYSWIQLNTTAGEVVILNPESKQASFIAPSQSDFLEFQFTATDSQNQSASVVVTVQVSPTGGSSGGGGGGGEEEGDNGTPSGTTGGTTVCSGSGNLPAVATVPANYTIDEGNQAAITAIDGNDPDDTEVFVGGQLLSGVFYHWSVASGAGVLSSSDLLDKTKATVRFEAPSVTSTTNLTLKLLVNDPASCGTSYQVNVTVNDVVSNNEPPTARLTYQIDGGDIIEASNQSANVTAPATVRLDASNSTDPDGTLSYSFALQQNLTAGGAILTEVSDAVNELTIQTGSQGSVSVTLTAVDDQNESDSVTLQFTIEEPALMPVAEAKVRVDDVELPSGEPVDEDVVVTLDGTGSHLADNSQPTTLTYEWRQTSGPPINILGADQAVAQFRTPEVDSSNVAFGFELLVSNAGLTSDPASVSVGVTVAPMFFGQIAFGPLGEEEFRTGVVLINNHYLAAQEVTIEFSDQAGEPLPVALNGEPWDPTTPIQLGASDSVILKFEPLQGEGLTVGWARVTSDVRLTGLVLYQLVNPDSGEVNSEVSLFSSPLGSELTTFYDVEDGLAAAIANPGTTEAKLNVKLIDAAFGPDLPLLSQPLILQPGEQQARFLDATYFGQFPEGFTSGTLVIEAVEGRVIVTILKTKAGVAFSTLPLAVLK